MLKIERGSLWEYVGDQIKYRHSKHIVLMVTNLEDDTEVITWAKTPSITWLGNVSDFLHSFKPTTGTFNFI